MDHAIYWVMVEEVSIAGLRAGRAFRRARLMVWVQSVVIFLLLVWVAAEYDHNQYFQAWAERSLGVFGFLLNGTIAAFYAGALIAFYLNQALPKPGGEEVRREEEIFVAAETG